MHVLLVDDHHLFRQGMKLLLGNLAPDIGFMEADSCAQALALRCEPLPSLVLVDLYMPGENALDVLRAMRDGFDSASLVVLSSEDSPEMVRKAIEAGASGFVPKASSPEALIAALQAVMQGGTYIPQQALRAWSMTAPAVQAPSAPRELDVLSARQMEVLLKAVQGKANKVIAREMHLSEGTVKAHLSAAYRTLGVANRTEAVFAAARLGLGPSPARTLAH